MVTFVSDPVVLLFLDVTLKTVLGRVYPSEILTKEEGHVTFRVIGPVSGNLENVTVSGIPYVCGLKSTIAEIFGLTI